MLRALAHLLLLTCIAAAATPGARADRIVVNKSKRELLLYREGKVIRAYRVALGGNPVGPKQRQGDHRTPEGEYSISGRNPASAYHRALRISYPNADDRARALQAGVRPGGDILIHGLPNRQHLADAEYEVTDWTDGCIAVNNAEIEEIWRLVPDGTPIRINP